jgi:hypothetical protein
LRITDIARRATSNRLNVVIGFLLLDRGQQRLHSFDHGQIAVRAGPRPKCPADRVIELYTATKEPERFQ